MSDAPSWGIARLSLSSLLAPFWLSCSGERSCFGICAPALVVALFSTLSIALSRVEANQFPYLDPTYTQQIYTGPLVGGPGMAWTASGDLLTRNGSDIIEYSPTQNATHQGTPIHASTVTHTITGLSNTGYGMTNGLDGYIYTVTSGGLERFNPSNWAAPANFCREPWGARATASPPCPTAALLIPTAAPQATSISTTRLPTRIR